MKDAAWSADIEFRSFAAAQEVLRNPGMLQALYDAGEQVMADALITLHGDAHQQRRMMEMTVFNRGFFRHYEHVVFPAALQPLLAPCVAAGEADLVEFGYRVTMNLTADFAGIDRDADTPQETDKLLSLVKKFSEGATMVHSTRDPTELRAEVDAAMQTFDESFLTPSSERRLALVEAFERGELAEADLPRDVITTLLRNRERHPLAGDVFRREIAFYLQAGAHSTANSMVRALHEIFAWRDANPARWRARGDDALFIQRCVHESLRLNPASPVAWRRPLTDVCVAGQDIQAGRRVVVDLKAANRDRSVYGHDADRFNPERTLGANAWPWGLSFGYGVHACLGRTLDGGVQSTDTTNPQSHQYGIVTLLVCKLLELGVTPHGASRPGGGQRHQPRHLVQLSCLLFWRTGRMKNMFVTGAANGLGARVAERAVEQGYRVGLFDLNSDATGSLADKLSNAVALTGDVCDQASVEAAIDAFGTVDVLVNNAGILRTDPLMEHSVEDFRLVIDVNLNGVFVAAQAAARRMRTGGGVIINLASINGIHPSPNCGAYAAAKAGVIGLTQHMSLEWGQYGIRVNAVAPGFIDSGMSAPFYRDARIRELRGNAVPLKRLGSADDVAGTILFLASEEAAYITGQTIAIDGGVVNSVLLHLPRE